MKKVIALGGSNSKKSINKQLATYAASLLKDAEAEVLDLNDFDLPIYSIDIEGEKGLPTDAVRLNSLFEKCDGFIISLAEHNGSFSAAFKSAIDWVSRAGGKIFKEKPMLIMATSPGGRGGSSVLETAVSIFPYRGAVIVDSFSLPSFPNNFKNGKIVNEDYNASLKAKVEAFEAEL